MYFKPHVGMKNPAKPRQANVTYIDIAINENTAIIIDHPIMASNIFNSDNDKIMPGTLGRLILIRIYAKINTIARKNDDTVHHRSNIV